MVGWRESDLPPKRAAVLTAKSLISSSVRGMYCSGDFASGDASEVLLRVLEGKDELGDFADFVEDDEQLMVLLKRIVDLQ